MRVTTLSHPFLLYGVKLSVIKSDLSGIEKKFEELCLQVVDDCGLELYDIDYINGSKTLKLFVIDAKTNSAVIDDCMKVDRAMTPFIEEEEWMPDELTLEVSSPGVYRQLNKLEHFKSSVGENIFLSTKIKLDESFCTGISKSLNGQKKFIANLVEVKDDGLTLKAESFKFFIKYEDIKKANLEPEIENLERMDI